MDQGKECKEKMRSGHGMSFQPRYVQGQGTSDNLLTAQKVSEKNLCITGGEQYSSNKQPTNLSQNFIVEKQPSVSSRFAAVFKITQPLVSNVSPSLPSPASTTSSTVGTSSANNLSEVIGQVSARSSLPLAGVREAFVVTPIGSAGIDSETKTRQRPRFVLVPVKKGHVPTSSALKKTRINVSTDQTKNSMQVSKINQILGKHCTIAPKPHGNVMIHPEQASVQHDLDPQLEKKLIPWTCFNKDLGKDRRYVLCEVIDNNSSAYIDKKYVWCPVDSAPSIQQENAVDLKTDAIPCVPYSADPSQSKLSPWLSSSGNSPSAGDGQLLVNNEPVCIPEDCEPTTTPPDCASGEGETGDDRKRASLISGSKNDPVIPDKINQTNPNSPYCYSSSQENAIENSCTPGTINDMTVVEPIYISDNDNDDEPPLVAGGSGGTINRSEPGPTSKVGNKNKRPMVTKVLKGNNWHSKLKKAMKIVKEKRRRAREMNVPKNSGIEKDKNEGRMEMVKGSTLGSLVMTDNPSLPSFPSEEISSEQSLQWHHPPLQWHHPCTDAAAESVAGSKLNANSAFSLGANLTGCHGDVEAPGATKENGELPTIKSLKEKRKKKLRIRKVFTLVSAAGLEQVRKNLDEISGSKNDPDGIPYKTNPRKSSDCHPCSLQNPIENSCPPGTTNDVTNIEPIYISDNDDEPTLSPTVGSGSGGTTSRSNPGTKPKAGKNKNKNRKIVSKNLEDNTWHSLLKKAMKKLKKKRKRAREMNVAKNTANKKRNNEEKGINLDSLLKTILPSGPDPSLPPCPSDEISSKQSFRWQWHHPCTDAATAAAGSMLNENSSFSSAADLSGCYGDVEDPGPTKADEELPMKKNIGENRKKKLGINEVFTLGSSAKHEQACENPDERASANFARPPMQCEASSQDRFCWPNQCTDSGKAVGEGLGDQLEFKSEPLSDCDEPSQVSSLAVHAKAGKHEVDDANGLQSTDDWLNSVGGGHDPQTEQENVVKDEFKTGSNPGEIIDSAPQQGQNCDVVEDKYLPEAVEPWVKVEIDSSCNNHDSNSFGINATTLIGTTASTSAELPSLFPNTSATSSKFQLTEGKFDRPMPHKMENGVGLKMPNPPTELKRMLERGEERPRKIPKNIHSPAYHSKLPDSQIGKSFMSRTGVLIDIEKNVLRDCIVRKAIIDCYIKGKAPTLDIIYKACCDSGLVITPDSVESHLKSIGYCWACLPNHSLLVENHKFVAERTKYLNKLSKYRGKNFVYIFVSEYVKKSENGWLMTPVDWRSQCLDSTRVVLHAMSNGCLFESGLEVLKSGLFRLRHVDIISWLKCNVFPFIPEGSVIIFGHHPLFEKTEEAEERPNITFSKEEIVSWLTSHRVTSFDRNLPKALLLNKADRVILPKTCIIDKVIREKRFLPLHLPEHHFELNPLNFLWQEIVDKLHNSPEIQTGDDFQRFVTREFSHSRMASRAAWSISTEFENSYRAFDSCFDQLFEKITSVSDQASSASVPDVAQVSTVAENPSQADSKYSTCPVCLKPQKLKGYVRCSSCKNFWIKLKTDYKMHRRWGGKPLPFCDNMTRGRGCPVKDCQGCRRYRYELTLYHHAIFLKKSINHVISIPPVSELGKKHWSEKFQRLTQTDPSFKEPEEGIN